MLLANVPSPNGVALSPDERVLYLGATRGNQVWRVPLQGDGSVAKVSAFFRSYGPSGYDGLAVDETGRVIVANPGLGIVWMLSPRGEPEVVLRRCLADERRLRRPRSQHAVLHRVCQRLGAAGHPGAPRAAHSPRQAAMSRAFHRDHRRLARTLDEHRQEPCLLLAF